MFKNLSYKQKFYAVIGCFIILLLAGYKKTYKQVFLVKSELNEVENKLKSASGAFGTIYGLKNDVAILDNVIGGHTSNPTQVQQMFFDFVTDSKSKVNLISLEDPHVFRNGEFIVYTNQAELEGNYTDLMQLLYEIEKNFKSSRVVSNSLYTKKNYTNNKTKLYLKIILQNYEKA